MEELVVSTHEFESFSKWYRYREPVVSGCVQGVSSTRNIQFLVYVFGFRSFHCKYWAVQELQIHMDETLVIAPSFCGQIR